MHMIGNQSEELIQRRGLGYKRTLHSTYSRSVIDCYLKSSHGKFDSVVKLVGEFMRLTNRQISNYGKKEGTTRRIEKIFGRIYGRNWFTPVINVFRCHPLLLTTERDRIQQ